MELKEIKLIIDLMARNGLSEFELERPEFKIRVKRNSAGEFLPVVAPQHIMAAPLQAPAIPVAATSVAHSPAPAAAPVPQETGATINSPMVGTFYSSPAPGSPAYVEVGQEVNEDTVVCIIEAMKVMNEIKAEMKGVITQVLVENGKPVEFGKPLFRIQPKA